MKHCTWLRTPLMTLLASGLLFCVLFGADSFRRVQAGEKATPSEAAKKYVLAITQIVEHPSLDDVRRGALAYLSEKGLKEKDRLTVEYSNAQGNMITNGAIAQKILGKRPDVILAIGTPAAQAVVTKNTSVPVVFSPITDPVEAKLVKTWEKPGGIATGSSDRSPIREQMELIKKIVPGVRSVAILYNPGEANSVATVERFRQACQDLGLKPVAAPVQGTAMVYATASSIKADAIYVPTDNTVVAAVEAVIKAGIATKTPVFSSEASSVDKGCIATLGVNYFELGRMAGEQIVAILEKKAQPGELPVRQQSSYELHINEKNASKMGVEIPAALRAKAIMH